MSAYTDQLDAPEAPAWVSAEGDRIIGRVTDLDTYEGDYGESVVATVEVSDDTSTEDGEAIEQGESRRVFFFGAVLAGEVKKQQPQIGDLIGVANKGLSDKKPAKGKAKTKLFRLRVFERGQYGTALEAGRVAQLARSAEEMPEPRPDGLHTVPQTQSEKAVQSAEVAAAIAAGVQVADDPDF